MKKITLAISLLFGLGATVHSQEQTLQLLLHADRRTECLPLAFLGGPGERSEAARMSLGSVFLNRRLEFAT